MTRLENREQLAIIPHRKRVKVDSICRCIVTFMVLPCIRQKAMFTSQRRQLHNMVFNARE
jgi:hypothetical protein